MARVAEDLGFPLQPWQRHVCDIALEYDAHTGKFAYREVIVTVPRQSGKTTLILPLEVWRCVGLGLSQRVIYTAQTGKDARLKFIDDQLPLLQRSPYKSFFKPRMSNGSEAAVWKNGSILTLAATTEKAGHGQTIDMACIDEAFAQTDNRLEQAFKPAMITRANPQQWVISTAGTGDSSFLWGKVERGRQLVEAGETSGVAYFEWSAHDDADPASPETWRSCMPALNQLPNVTEDAIRSDFLSMEPAEFMRAYLNRWTTAKLLPPIPLEAWQRCRDTSTQPTDDITFAVDVSPDRRFASIVVTSRLADGRVHVELVPEQAGGIDWVVPWIIDRWPVHSPSAVWIDPAGPAGSFIQELQAAGVVVETVSAREMGQACAALYDIVLGGGISHRGDVRILTALDAGVKRYLGDLWLWSRSAASADITPAVALTLGVYGVREPLPKAAPVFAY